MALHEQSFPTFEDLTERMTELSGRRLPPVVEGSTASLRSVRAWLRASKVCLTLPDPSLNLAMPFPRDELHLAIAQSQLRSPSSSEIEDHASVFGISSALLDRPTVTLSGGERMLVSLAKAHALSSTSGTNIIVSPYFWLDQDSTARAENLMNHLRSLERPSYLLLLDGEDSPELPSTPSQDPAIQSEIRWSLAIKSLTVTFPEVSFPRRSAGHTIRFRSAKDSHSLKSPTILVGPNGIGKTTLCKVLSGVCAPAHGHARLVTNGFSGKARLLLQDPLLQLFSMSPADHLHRVFSHDKERKKASLALYRELQDGVASLLAEAAPGVPVGARDGDSSILQAKLALAAERLSTPTSLVILDEPGWCLSRTVARAYLKCVTNAAHKRNTALLVVSHQQTWWNGIVASSLSLSRDGENVYLNSENRL